MEGAAGLVEWIVLSAPPPECVALDPATALIERIAGQPHDVKGIHHRHRVGQFLAGGGLKPGEPVHRDDLDSLPPRLRAASEPLLEHRLRAAFDHVQQPRGPRLLVDWGEVDDHGDVLIAVAGVAPDVLIDTEHPNPVEPAGVIDEHSAPLGEDRIIGRVPGHPETCGDARDGQMVDHDPFQSPPHPATGQLRPLGRRSGEVLTPGTPAPRAPVATDAHQQRRRAMPERLMRQTPRIRPSRQRLAAAAPAPRIRLSDPALDHRPIRVQTLADGHEAELVEAAEDREIRTRKGSVRHVEVFRQMASVRTSIIGGPRPSSGHRRAQPATRSSTKSLLFIKTLRWQGLIIKSLKRSSDCSVASFKLSTFSLLLWLHEFHARLMSLIAYLVIRLIKQVTSFIQSIIRFSGLSKDFTGVLLIPCPFC